MSKKPIPYMIANQNFILNVESLLNQMKQPINDNPPVQKKLREDMKKLLKEIVEITQQQLALNHAGKPTGVKADITGWTTATTDYDNDIVLQQYPHGKIVNIILKEIIAEQEQEALKAGVAVSQQQILNAQADAVDPTKDTITLTTLKDESGNQSKVEIDKTNGDTQLYELDQETGLWKKVGIKIKGYWKNVKNFCKNIWDWVKEKFSKAKEWIKSIFKSPEDADVIIYQQTA